ncbi:unnamed protein product [Spodoptera littoralis]|uniref:Uncharacterized protein n=1 Tax=Spodoptera littoralis TaxID=7109 RepID=A0A9P0HZ96_SPOLI|nr:unnamed protein product [Spodoptera littoralis]CAH1637152.1 unnamed protein product [Spodoptera littoralis]
MTCDTTTNLHGKVIVVTGGSSGMGFAAAKNLASHGARVIITSRNETKLKAAQHHIIEATGNYNVEYKTVDLGSLKSVRNLASELNAEDQINVLINNAGAVGLPDRMTPDHLNLNMQVNYFGTFLLTFLLLPKLKASAPSRILNGVGAAMYFGEINFDHWNDVGRYDIVKALGSSELAINLFNEELSRKLRYDGVTANAYDPFVVRDTDILQNLSGIVKKISKLFINVVGQSREDAGREIAYLASAPELEGVSGNLYKFCHKFKNHWLVNDRHLTKRLWEESKKAVKITKYEDWEHHDSK